MDTPLILTHRTAWQIYHAPLTKTVRSLDELPALELCGATPRCIHAALVDFLERLGVDKSSIDRIDLGVAPGSSRSTRRNLVRHAIDPKLVPAHTLKITENLRIVDPVLCLLQAASWMSLWELVEFGYELCGSYHGLDFLNTPAASCAGHNGRATDERDGAHTWTPDHHANRLESATPRGVLTIEEIDRALEGEFKYRRGADRLEHALRYIHEGSRSPMESGLAMLVCLPPIEGGLGIEDIEMNHRVNVTGTAKALTKSAFFEIDVYHTRSRRGTEYDGHDHVTDTQREHDAERRNALEEMGYSFKVLTRGQFTSQLSLHRAMNAVARSFGIEPPTSKAFQARQNELRQFIIRGWERRDG